MGRDGEKEGRKGGAGRAEGGPDGEGREESGGRGFLTGKRVHKSRTTHPAPGETDTCLLIHADHIYFSHQHTGE